MVREQFPQARSTPVPDCPPLQSGDHLTRPEFERRYAAAPHIRKAEPAAEGQTRISSDGYIEGSPELIVEIAASSAAVASQFPEGVIDTGIKEQVCRRNGVLEYIVWLSY